MSRVEGKNPVLELLRSGAPVSLVQVAEGSEGDPGISEILRLADGRGILVEYVSRGRLRILSSTGREQGVIASVASPTYASFEKILKAGKRDLSVIVLDEVQDPQNLGSILRTAEATRVDVVVVPKRGSVGITPAVHRASMGGSVYIPVARENLFNVFKLLREEGVRVVAVDPSGPLDYFDVDLTGSLAIVLGGEGRGLSPVLLKKSELVVKVPMLGRLTSLNVGVAAALVMYERVRQQRSMDVGG